jgi:hypothetical protein
MARVEVWLCRCSEPLVRLTLLYHSDALPNTYALSQAAPSVDLRGCMSVRSGRPEV